MTAPDQIDNEIYKHYGDRWYTAINDPVALLRSEAKQKNTWVKEQLRPLNVHSVLDVGCGGGFLSNDLGQNGYLVTGIDISAECLEVAKRFDQTQHVNYIVADAYNLPFRDEHFDVVTCMDFLEHVEKPASVIKEISRVLKPNGILIFNTINRNILTWLLVIKVLPWIIKSTPKNMHLYRLFITPKELVQYCLVEEIQVQKMVGLVPILSTKLFKSYFAGTLSTKIDFKIIRSLFLSYMGMAKKKHHVHSYS
ncbi:MAG: 3-demethylubiquinone-9 3-O-methyltransferase [Bdellovibrio sp.]|nr:3-demethylubiquinone-9 3-O-methyltransferase [Bdellovibrio sp.]